MKPNNTIEVRVQDVRFEVSMDGDCPQDMFIDGVWLVGSVQELSCVLDPKVYDAIEEAARQELIEISEDLRVEAIIEERMEAWS
jgi:hypothetical protein